MSKKDNNVNKIDYKIIMLLIIEGICLFTCLFMAKLNSDKTELFPTISQWESRYVQYDDGWSINSNLYEELGEEELVDVIYGPFVPLNKGVYCVSIDYSSDESQEFEVYAYEHDDAIKSLEIQRLPGNALGGVVVVHFVVREFLENVEVRCRYNGIGSLKINNITVTRSNYHYKLFLLAALLVFIIIDILVLSKCDIFKLNQIFVLQLDKVFEYRSIWMALAIIAVCIFHSGMRFNSSALRIFKNFGYAGVDIFVFASGIGCYYSYSKDNNGVSFIGRRIAKIIPTYWIYLVVWLCYMVTANNMPWQAVIGNVFFDETLSWSGYEFNWYLGFMLVSYLIAPLLILTVRWCKTSKARMTLSLLLVFVFTLQYVDVHNEMIKTMSRIPLFYIGILFAYLEKDLKVVLKNSHILLMIISSGIGIKLLTFCTYNYEPVAFRRGLSWYPLILVVPGLCVIISFLAAQLEKIDLGKKIINVFSIVGKCTFEIYLVHGIIFELISKIDCQALALSENMIWVASIIPIALEVVVLRFLADKVRIVFAKMC